MMRCRDLHTPEGGRSRADRPWVRRDSGLLWPSRPGAPRDDRNREKNHAVRTDVVEPAGTNDAGQESADRKTCYALVGSREVASRS
jgi:hypothetical protein